MTMWQLPSETSANLTAGGDQMIVYVASQIPMAIPLLLFMVFMIIFLSGTFSTRRNEGRSETAMWFAVSSFMTTILATLMSLVPGIVTTDILIYCVAITCIGALWFFTTKDR